VIRYFVGSNSDNLTPVIIGTHHFLLSVSITFVVYLECNVIVSRDELPLEETPSFGDLTTDLVCSPSPNHYPLHLLPAGLGEVGQIELWRNITSVVGNLRVEEMWIWRRCVSVWVCG